MKQNDQTDTVDTNLTSVGNDKPHTRNDIEELSDMENQRLEKLTLERFKEELATILPMEQTLVNMGWQPEKSDPKFVVGRPSTETRIASLKNFLRENQPFYTMHDSSVLEEGSLTKIAMLGEPLIDVSDDESDKLGGKLLDRK